MNRPKLLLCVPPVVLALLDGGLTLALQPAEYWKNAAAVNEASPLWVAFLSRSPLAYLAAATVYLAIVCACIRFLPRRAAFIASLTVSLWHIVGASSWVLNSWGANGYWGGVIGLAFVAFALLRIWEKAGFRIIERV